MYLYVGNRPVNSIDPSGAFTNPIKPIPKLITGEPFPLCSYPNYEGACYENVVEGCEGYAEFLEQDC